MDETPDPRRGGRRRRAPRRVDEGYLRRVLLWYLERWDAPAAHARRKLLERVDRAVRHHGQEREPLVEMVDRVVAEAVDQGLLDDARYARNAVARGRDGGRSTRRISASLRAKGVAPDQIRAALDDAADEGRDDRIAVIRYARRRRFGPWRRPDRQGEDRFVNELASLVRAGFPYDLARQILQAEDAASLEDELPVGW